MKNLVRNRSGLFAACILGIMLCLPGLALSEEDSVELRVEKGDKLIHICRKYLEEPQKWPEVARFNRLKNPDLILPGQRINIPVRLMSGVPVDGKVTFVHGDARIQKDEKAEWAPLALGDLVPQGSRIRTGKASSVEVTFEESDAIFIKPDTNLGVTTSQKRGATYRVKDFGSFVKKFER
jgi:hypothetical protein